MSRHLRISDDGSASSFYFPSFPLSLHASLFIFPSLDFTLNSPFDVVTKATTTFTGILVPKTYGEDQVSRFNAIPLVDFDAKSIRIKNL